MSTVVYRTPSSQWEPQNIVDFFGEENLLTTPIGLNTQAGAAWCVVERRTSVRWGDLKTIEEISYELYVLYFDARRRLLYINNSANDGVFVELAEAVAGTELTGSRGPPSTGLWLTSTGWSRTQSASSTRTTSSAASPCTSGRT